MLKGALRSSLPVLAIVVVGPILAWPTGILNSATGTPDTTYLVSQSPVLGLIIALVTLTLVGVLGIAAARAFDTKTALLFTALTLAWVAWRTGNMTEVLAITPGTGTLIRMAIESAALGILGFAIIAAIHISAPRPENPGPRTGEPAEGPVWKDPATIGIALASAVAALVVASAVARGADRGQAILAAWVAGIAAGAVMCIVAPALNRPTSPLLAYASMALAAVAAPLASMFLGGADAKAVIAHAVPGLALIQPIDWVVGSMLGVGVGVGWFHSTASAHAKTADA